MLKFELDELYKKSFLWLVASIFFDAYCFFYISTYPVTLFSLASLFFCAVSVVRCFKQNSIRIAKDNLIAVAMMIYIILNSLVTGTYNISSALFSIMFFFIYVCANRKYDSVEMTKAIRMFRTFMNVMAIYGIYQFLGNIVGLPLTDIVIPNHMIEGFNRGNNIYLFGIKLMRSNAFFREPSFFSQYLAINILLYLSDLITKKQTDIRMLAINIIAMVCSFSGTGLLMLIFSLMIYCLRIKKSRKIVSRLLLFTILGIVGVIIILNSPLGKYYLIRLSEISAYDPNNFSGYVRFNGGKDVLIAAWNQNSILGVGIGTVDEFIHNLSNYYHGMTVNGFYRVAVELGILGISIWLYFVYACFRKENHENDHILAIQSILFPMMICHETFQSNYYWVFLALLNYKAASIMHKRKI